MEMPEHPWDGGLPPNATDRDKDVLSTAEWVIKNAEAFAGLANREVRDFITTSGLEYIGDILSRSCEALESTSDRHRAAIRWHPNAEEIGDYADALCEYAEELMESAEQDPVIVQLNCRWVPHRFSSYLRGDISSKSHEAILGIAQHGRSGVVRITSDENLHGAVLVLNGVSVGPLRERGRLGRIFMVKPSN